MCVRVCVGVCKKKRSTLTLAPSHTYTTHTCMHTNTRTHTQTHVHTLTQVLGGGAHQIASPDQCLAHNTNTRTHTHTCTHTHRSWEEERATLQAQISALHTASGGQHKNRASRSTDDWSNVDQEEMQELKDELNGVREMMGYGSVCACVCVCVCL